MATTYILPTSTHNALVEAAYRHRGYTADEAAAGAKFSELTAWHGIKTHNAIKALQRAAATTAGLKQIEALPRDLFRRPLVASELKVFDAVVFDPPRQGAEAQARELANSTVKTIVAVSCDPATFARDIRILVDGGYKLVGVTPVDQFRWSHHVEVVGKLER